MKKIVIDPVTRIEGHAKITSTWTTPASVSRHAVPRHPGARLRKVHRRPPVLRDAGDHRAHLRHLPGQPPAGVGQGLRRHHGGAHPPPAAVKLRELIHCAQFVQSHALSFFHLSAPDLLLGMDSDPAHRNIFGLIEENPEMARDGIALRKFGQEVIEGLAQERVHPSWIVPGGVNAPLDAEVRDRILAGLPDARALAGRTLDVLQEACSTGSRKRSPTSAPTPTMYAGLVDDDGGLQWYDGLLHSAMPPAPRSPPISARATTPSSSAKRRCAIRT